MTRMCEGRVVRRHRRGPGDRPRPRRGTRRRGGARRGQRRRRARPSREAVDALDRVRAATPSATSATSSTASTAPSDLVATALDRWGRLDVVVNNAGITRDRMLVNLAESDWDDVLRVHLKSTFLVTQTAARHWRERSKAGEVVDGRVINTVSAVGLYGTRRAVQLRRRQGGDRLVHASSPRWSSARYGVTVNAVCPTALTDMTEDVLGETDDARPACSTRRGCRPRSCGWPRRCRPT